MKIDIIPCLADNYAALIRDKGAVILVDAPEAKPILAYCEKHGIKITHILITHHHYDHIDGIEAIKLAHGAKVYGCEADAHRIPHIDHWFKVGESIKIGGRKFEVIDAPGHTLGHVCFYEKSLKALFSGDSLMAGGCGRLFEGTPTQMYETFKALRLIPDDVWVYSGHEYTLNNLRFALTIEPNNHALKNRYMSVDNMLANGEYSVPSSMGVERATNPYFRVKTAEQFALVRAKKDKF